MDTINRLQFRHHNEIFETREAAIDFIKDKLTRNGGEGIASEPGSPYTRSLLAEPTILRYGTEEDIHLILAIGAETNDTLYPDNNKFCIIDIDNVEENIEDLREALEKAIKSLTLIALSSDTINFYSEKTDDGTLVSGDVKIAETHIFDDKVLHNNLMTTPEGLFIYANLTYNEDTDIFTFTINNNDGTLSETSILLNHLVNAEYNVEDESIHLYMKNGDDIVIDCENLISEWDVEGDASKTPIVLTKEEVSYDGTDEHNHLEPWQDVLRADVRIAEDRPANILHKTDDGRYLYVDGMASNIVYYWNSERSNVKEQLDRLNEIKISPDRDNIIIDRADGYFASTRLDYISSSNTLVFTTSNVSGGETSKSIELNTVEVIKNAYYDKTTEELVIIFVDDKGEEKEVRVPIRELIDEWTVSNELHSVNLNKQTSVGSKDVLTADVNISNIENNILEERTEHNIHALFVKGTSDNIKYKNATVENAIDNLISEDVNINEKLNNEIERSINVDEKIEMTIGTGFSIDSHETITYKFNELQNQVDSESEKLQNEIGRSEDKDTEHDGRLDAIDAEIGDGFGPRNTIRDEIDNLYADIDSVSAYSSMRLSNVVNEDKSIDVETRNDDEGNPTVKVVKTNLSSEIEGEKPNIIKLNADGLYAGVDLSYVEEANKLIFKTTNGSKEIQLESMSSIISIEYNPTKEAIVITYLTNGHEVKTVEIPVGDLIREWKPSENTDGAIKLTLTEVPSGTTGKDILYGEVIISDHEDNILVNDGGMLYVSNSSITANTAAIDSLDGRMDTAEDDIDVLQDGLREEISDRTNSDNALGRRIDQEIEDRIADVNEEEERARDAELALLNKIDADILAEENRAIGIETSLDAKIEQEITNREAAVIAERTRAISAETSLFNKINSDVLSEENRAKSVENGLQTSINSEISRATSEEARIETKLNNEINRSTAKDSELSNSISDEITRAISEDESLSNRINSEVTRATAEELGLRTAVSAEINRAVSAEAELRTSASTLVSGLANEINRAQAAEASIQSQVDANKLSFHDTSTIDLIRTEGSPGIIEGHVKLATGDDNIIKVDDSSYGIYASVDLSYDLATNTLTFRSSNGTNKTMTLYTGSVINRAWFDDETKELVLEFIKSDGTTYEVRIPASDLFNQWDVDNDRSIAITLEKTNNGENTDLLTAKVNVSQAEDNLLTVRDNHLYVNGSGVSKVISDNEIISGNLETLRTTINGDSQGYTYPNHVTSHFISAATSYDEADMLLDNALYGIIDKWFISGFETCTTHTDIKQIGQNRHMLVDVRMSHGNKATGMTDDELSMTDIDDKYFSDTNVLRYINVTETRDHQHLDPDNGYNGMYLSNYWDCGKYYQTETEGTEIAQMVAEGFEVYNTNYKTDERPDASGYDYNNNVRQ